MDRQRKSIEDLADVLKTISHPERIAIILFIGQCSHDTARVKEIYETLNLSQSNASRHLGLMKRHGIVNRIQKNGDTYFSINLHNPIVTCIQSCVKDLTATREKIRT